jgi:hypothetical protein
MTPSISRHGTCLTVADETGIPFVTLWPTREIADVEAMAGALATEYPEAAERLIEMAVEMVEEER